MFATPKRVRRFVELIEKIDFSVKAQDNAWLVHRAYELYPEDVVGAFVSLLESGKPVPSGTDELLKTSDLVIDEGPLVERVLRSSGEDRGAESAVSIIGPKTIGQLIDQIFRIHGRIKENNGKYDKALSDEYHRLCHWISNTKADSFIQSVLEHAATERARRNCLTI